MSNFVPASTETTDYSRAPVSSDCFKTNTSERKEYNDKIWFRAWIMPENEGAYDSAVAFLFEKLGVARPNVSQKRNMKGLLANLVHLHLNHPDWVMVYFRGRSRWLGKDDWRNPYKLGFGVVDIIKRMSDAQYIEGPTGYRGAHKSRASRMWPTSKLIVDVFDSFLLLEEPIKQHEDFLYVRVQIEGKMVPLPDDNAALGPMIHMLKRYNSQLKKSDIRLGDKSEKRSKEIYRVFSKPTLDGGGRFYGAWWTFEHRDLRPLITIDGHKTVELDFKAMHIYLLYDLMVGIPYSQVWNDGEPYRVICSATGELYPRQLIKDVVLIAINSGSETETWRALKEKYTRSEDANGEYLNKYARNTGVFSAVYEDLTRKHYYLESHLSKSRGLYLQYLDSQISEVVLDKMTSLGVTALCIHDSFIVQEEKEAELKQAMMDAYQEITGAMLTPPIERKKVNTYEEHNTH